jgi:hypothetical protein
MICTKSIYQNVANNYTHLCRFSLHQLCLYMSTHFWDIPMTYLQPLSDERNIYFTIITYYIPANAINTIFISITDCMPNQIRWWWILTQWYVYNMPNRVHWNDYSMVKPYAIIIYYVPAKAVNTIIISITNCMPSQIHWWWILTQWYVYNMPNRVHWNHYSMVTPYAMV